MEKNATYTRVGLSKVLLIFLLLFSGVILGQTTVTIGSGTNTTANYPITAYYGYSYTQQIFTQAQINFAGNIQKLRFYKSTVGSVSNSSSWVIYMGHTTKTSFSGTADWIASSGLTEVFSGTVTFPSSGWMEITLSTQFAYNNTDNLVIAVDENTSLYHSSDVNWYSFAPSADYRGIYYRNDNTNPNPSSPPTATGRTTSINQIQLDIQSFSNMAFVSSTTEQGSTNAVLPGTTNQEIIRLKIVTDGSQSPFNLTSVTFNTAGSTSASDISNARVYYTTTTTFSTATPFGDAVANPSGAITVTGTQVLSSGNNYFWLAYDIAGGATEYNVVDATCTQFITSEAKTTRTPDVTAPAGSRTIRNPLTGIKTIAAAGTYTSFTAAINELNLLGIGAGGVTFNVASGETFNEGAPMTISVTGTSGNPIIFQKNGGGAKPIINITGTAGSSDAGFKLNGGDYFTFDGMDVRDAGTTSTDYLEFGFHLAGLATDGCRNNTIKNCVVDLTKNNASSRGIYVYSSATDLSGTNNLNLLYNNTVQDASYGYYLYGTSSYTDDMNEIGIVDAGTSTITNCGNYGIYFAYQTNLKIFNNNINNFSTSTTSLYGIYTGLGSANTVRIYNNSINDFTNTYSSGNIYGIYITSGTTYDIYSNNIYNLSGTPTSSSYYVYGIYHTSGTTNNIYSNNIYSVSSTQIARGIYITALGTNSIYLNNIYGISSSGNTVDGVNLSGGTTSFYKNKIYNIYYSGTSSYVTYGLNVGGGTTNNIYNNFIYDIKAPASTGSPGVRGMNLNGGTTNNVFNNTVFLNYISTSASNQSAALYLTTSPTTVDLRNNIFVNNTDVTTGTRAVAFYRSSTTYTNFSTNSNNNIYYAGVPGAKNLIFYDGTNSDQTLAAYKTRMSTRDQNAMTENVPFVSTTEAIDPHISDEVETQVESGGIRITSPFAVTTDIDGDTRALETGYSGSGTAPDVGADEGEYKGLDLNAPTITYTPLGNSSTTGNRTLTASITDASGIPTSGTGLPVLYWKINDGSYTSATGSFVSGNNYQFTFGAGVVAGDVVAYYIVAQDQAVVPNVGVYPSAGASGFSANPPAVSTPPSSPSTYIIVGSITGEILVGAGETYTSLTANTSEGLFKAINEKVVTGNLTVKITSNLTETGAVALNQTTEEAIYSITIQPNDASNKTISGSYAGGLIRLNGADGVTFDGRYGGSGNYLTISNTNTSTNTAAIQLISLGTGAGATNNTIRNCNIMAGTPGTSSVLTYAVFLGAATISSGAANDNDNNSIINNVISKAYYGIYARATATGVNDNLTISGNTIGAEASGDYIGKYGIDLAYGTGATVSGNTIYNIIGTNQNLFGIQIGTSVSNSEISKNNIHSIKYTGSTGYGGKGIDIATGSNTSNLTISNNIIYDISGDGYTTGSGDAIYGIRIQSSQGAIKLYYNSVNLYGSITRSSASADQNYALYIGSPVVNLDIRDNIFSNSIENTTGVSTSYAIFSASTNAAFSTINYNDYYASGVEGVLGYLSSNKTTLTDWQAATTQDANSIASDPQFRANNNLQPLTGSPVLSTGTPVAGITTDYTNYTRSETTPSIGAYETGFTPPGVDWANLQWPSTGNIPEGATLTVYAQVYEPGVTPDPGQGAGIQCWIGWSTDNTNPNTWTNWTAAAFNTQSGNNDEYKANIGGNLPAGTYYYASRWLITDGAYQYGGYNAGGGGFWDGTTNVSGVLTVTNGVIGWANLQFPSTASIQEGGSADVYARVWIDGVTTSSDPSTGVQCWIGWDDDNTNPNTWTNWTLATFTAHQGNNDEYKATIGAGITEGTYYYASRFKLINDDYVYGGYSTDGGNFWDGTPNISGILTVNPLTISTFPHFEGFEAGLIPPSGWKNPDGLVTRGTEPKSGIYCARITYNHAAPNGVILRTPLINLPSNFRINFWWKDDDITAGKSVTGHDGELVPDEIEIVGHDTTYLEISTDQIAWTQLAILSAPSSQSVYTQQKCDLSAYGGQAVYLRWRDKTDASWDAYGTGIDDIQFEENPAATNTQTIGAGSTAATEFTGTGVTIQFTANTGGALNLIVDKIVDPPGGNPPAGLLNVANQYWAITVTSGTVSGTYNITLDLTGVQGINECSTLHLMKRYNAGSDWVDFGTPSDCSNFPLVTWSGLTSFSEFGLGGLVDNPLPVELNTFAAVVSGRDVTLNWNTKTETGANKFTVEKNVNGEWKSIGEVKASGNSNSPKDYSFTDKKLNSGKYSYRLKMIDNDGTFDYSEVTEAEVELPKDFALNQNYPNPFNPSTVISYQLPKDADVRLEIYGITGEKVATVIDQKQEAGYYNYTLSANAFGLSSGVYIYRIIAGEFVNTKKMVLIK